MVWAALLKLTHHPHIVRCRHSNASAAYIYGTGPFRQGTLSKQERGVRLGLASLYTMASIRSDADVGSRSPTELPAMG
jgi:hypothetical protein